MTTTSRTATTAQSNHVNPALRAPIVVAPRGRRRPGLITAGVALAMLGALLGVRLVATAGDRTGVVVLARDVPYGSVLTAEDLRVTQVSVDPTVATVPADHTSSVVGMTAAADLVAGSLLAPAQVAAAGPPGHGEVVVPLPLDAKKLPAGRLVAGERLLVVDTPPADADPPSGEVRTFAVSVARLGPPDLNGVSVIDVVAAEGDGPALAARAATGRFALVVLPPRGNS